MAVTFDSSGKQTVGGTSTVVAVCSFTVAAGAVLLVGVATPTTISISACAVNGTPMTQLGRILHTSAGFSSTLYGLTAPPSGVVSISAGLVGGVANQLFIIGASYLGAKSVNPFGTVTTKSDSAVTTSVIGFSTSTTDMVTLFAGGFNSFSFTATLATTRQSDGNHHISRWVDAAGTGATMSLSCSSVVTTQNLYWIGVNIAATATAVGSTIPSFLAMVNVGI